MIDRGDAGMPLQLLRSLNCALFLDFDGTLADLAAKPDEVAVAPDVLPTLAALHRRLKGRLAIISGRPIAQIDALLWPLRLPAAGVHGMERRSADGALHYAPLPALAGLRAAALELAARHPGLWVEEKYGALALHYRQVPELALLCRATMAQAVQHSPGTTLMEGKMIVEVKSLGVDKGRAIGAFLAEAPFAGYPPVFAGDDTTDEAGFAIVQQAGGMGLKVGQGPSIARHGIATPQALRLALAQVVERLTKGELT